MRMWIFGLLLMGVLLFGCTQNQTNPSIIIGNGNSSQVQSSPQTFEQLRQVHAAGETEYQKCLAEVKRNKVAFRTCIDEKLATKGYTDHLDCIKDFNNPICQTPGNLTHSGNSSRYNAEVTGYNECREQFITDGMMFVEFDCAPLISK